MIGKDENYITGIYTYIYEDEKYYEKFFSCPGSSMYLPLDVVTRCFSHLYSSQYDWYKWEIHLVTKVSDSKIGKCSHSAGTNYLDHRKSHVAPFSRMVFEPACLLVQILTGFNSCWLHHMATAALLITRQEVVCTRRSESRPNFSHHLYTICAEGIIDSLNSLDVHNWNLVHYVWTCFMSPDWNDTEYWQSWILLDTKFWNLNAQCRWSRL